MRTEPSSDAAKFLLLCLNKLNVPMYEGTVPAHVVARRRARNKVAKQSRKRNRGQ